MVDTIISVLQSIALVISVIGATVIIYGALFSSYHYLLELLGKSHVGRSLNVDHIRLEFGRNIALGIEFFVAADIIQTVVVPGYYEIGLLALLIVIRTVLSYFLNQELLRLKPDERGKLR